MSKIPKFIPFVVNHLRCTNCNHPHNHKHGSYLRKGTHKSAIAIRILRRRCLSCSKTFSILPQNFLPIMRWRLSTIIRVKKLLASGISVWRLALVLKVSFGALLRLSRKLPLLSKVWHDLKRSKGVFEPIESSIYMDLILSLWSGWHKFTVEFSRVLYPLLHKVLATPHKL